MTLSYYTHSPHQRLVENSPCTICSGCDSTSVQNGRSVSRGGAHSVNKGVNSWPFCLRGPEGIIQPGYDNCLGNNWLAAYDDLAAVNIDVGPGPSRLWRLGAGRRGFQLCLRTMVIWNKFCLLTSRYYRETVGWSDLVNAALTNSTNVKLSCLVGVSNNSLHSDILLLISS